MMERPYDGRGVTFRGSKRNLGVLGKPRILLIVTGFTVSRAGSLPSRKPLDR